jgi:hypothetical protein
MEEGHPGGEGPLGTLGQIRRNMGVRIICKEGLSGVFFR